MNILQITPGAGAMYCGNCLRDNALVAEFRKAGHQALLVPLYLPLTLDEEDQSAATPIFFSGINVYLQQKSRLFGRVPHWLNRLLARRRLLKWVARRAAKTRPSSLGDLTLSMLQGEEGHQGRELKELLDWLKTQPRPEVICLSNALLVGLLRGLRSGLGRPVVCMLQGEDAFLDALPEPYRSASWELLAQRVAEADGLVTPSEYFRDLMARRLGIPAKRIHVIYNGINLHGYEAPTGASATIASSTPALGFFARLCPEKGLDILVEAYLLLRNRPAGRGLKLKVGGSCGPADRPFVEALRARLRSAGALDDVEFHPNLDRERKIEFLKSLSLFSVPMPGSEAFGLYAIEAMAAGVPVVQPMNGAFPELLRETGGGVLCAPGAQSLADAIGLLLLDPQRLRKLGQAGQAAVFERFSVQAMAQATLGYYRTLV